MKRTNIIIITGTRADYGLLKPVLKTMSKSKKIKFGLLVTGIHTLKKFGSTVKEIEKDGWPIVCVVSISEKEDVLQALCKEISGIRNYCIKHKPDLILVHGDRDEALAGAIVAGHLKIPVAHISGGDITGSLGPDEANRHAITKFSHLHFPNNINSYDRIIKLGEERSRVFNVGALALEDLPKTNFLTKTELSRRFSLNKNKKWFLMIHHPTPLDSVPFTDQIGPLLKTLSLKKDSEKIIIYPNADTGSDIFVNEIEKYRNRDGFHVFKNLPRIQYLSFLKNVDLLIGNSSSGIVESDFFHLPTVNVGDRQGRRERGTNVINSGYRSVEIEKAIKKALIVDFKINYKKSKNIYGKGNSAEKIVRVIEQNISRPDLFLKQSKF